ncbi:hypothetical protein [Clostridium beijerinckii]|nr:hypothetical protein [Clostridium beijerinckii]NRT72145.1 hypothetical protein [Clostridium beijerinckii]
MRLQNGNKRDRYKGKKESFGRIDISEKSNLNNITRKLKSYKEM